ncbi:MAG: tRNA (adenosine(37)-N6)-dimethylallyltransferase MiaA [Verrucomicrobiae bacterium]|nr:tRNA (adenosine(37)-N6)-dimethylallyltransferase MiaA [Verrucomicrobiae bacterium]
MNLDWQRTLLLAGPTASGKSAVALSLVERLQGEIVSVDSMQVYRGLDLGTAKATPAERRRVSHHLIDVAGVSEPFDVARYRTLALDAVNDILARGRIPILCGGTGLYFKALLAGLDPLPPSDPAVRAELETTPVESLLAELRRDDPEALANLDLANPRRIQRAVELRRLTGQTWAARRAAWSPDNASPEAAVWCLRRDRADLTARIDRRVEAMFAAGLVAETQSALAAGLADNRTALQAIGYRQVVEHLRGERDLPETIALVKQRTRQFARRQMTWFRHQLPVHWVDVSADEPAEATAARIVQARNPEPVAHPVTRC